MPTTPLMTFERAKNRWKKIYKAKPYWVSLFRLNLPPDKQTEYGSMTAANEWWRAKKAEIDAAEVPPPPTRAETVVRTAQRKVEWAKQHDPDAVDDLATVAKKTSRLLALEKVRPGEASNRADDIELHEPLYHLMQLTASFGKDVTEWPREVLVEYFGEQRIWRDRFKLQEKKTTPDKAFSVWQKKYLDHYEARGQGVSTARKRSVRQALKHFETMFGAGTSIEAINGATIEDFHRFLSEHETVKSNASKGLYQRCVHDFIKYLDELEMIESPKAMKSRRYGFERDEADKEVFNHETLKALLAKATGPMRLHVLLALNCSFYPIDISSLTAAQVDWKKGTITHKRIKTRKKSSVPTVVYPLWSETAELLKAQRSKGERLLTTREGTPLMAANGFDNIGDRFRDFIRKNNFKASKDLNAAPTMTASFGTLRNTAATILSSVAEHESSARHFLGQAPLKGDHMKRHYVAPSLERFEAAVKWLGEQIGVK
jgi:integrase